MKKSRKGKIKFKYIVLLLLISIIGTIVFDYARISRYKKIPGRPSEKIDLRINELQYQLANGEDNIDWSQLDGALEYIKNEYDCSDFRLVNLIRVLYEADNQIPVIYKKAIEEVLFNFRYWWDDPGENSMCYWSENHQILFASAEYLIGQKYPEVLFRNSGLTGKQHLERARIRAIDWLEMRWKYGFTEFFSGTYYTEDIAALINLIDFANDDEIVAKSQIILDLLFYDLASQSTNAMFVSASGRAYEGNRKGGPCRAMGGLTCYYWADGKELGPGMVYGMMTTKKYIVPPVFSEIARDTSNVIIKQSNGLDISELKSEGYFGTDNRSMMMQWGMEAFTNPEIIRNSMKHIRNCNMFSNDFLAEFKILDFTLIKWLALEPSISRFLNPQSNGVAIQKGNTYTYKTKDYSMYTAQSYHPGTYGDQQHIFGMNIKNHFSIFHNHPALEKEISHQSPNYWVGYGHIPHSVQDENVNLSIYSIPDKKGLMEMDLLNYTHGYFPFEKFDTAFIDHNYVFGKKDETYCAFIGAHNFELRNEAKDDIIQKGKRTFWITEAGSRTVDGHFSDFVERIKTNRIKFEEETLVLSYQSNGKNYELDFKKDFKIDGKVIDTNYMRFDSPYVKANVKDEIITFRHNGKELFLDFDNMIRKFSESSTYAEEI
ncbi:MAG: hypothetical protein JJU28_17110 [Cyclobacteriaceae bacterium]|nr:hypothetical protein [Cyclobacteriaceae bacterium]